ncbi:MAG TPA: hypothetical protein VFQ25_10645 [Ktedonobacterales bacterium]|nr:hypothetical protein [Ktedonobacterales bacterium]
MAQEDTYAIPEIRWWGLPVGLSLMVAGGAATFYANQGITDTMTGVVGAIAFLVLVAGIVSFGAFVYSIIARGVGKTEAKRYIPSAH